MILKTNTHMINLDNILLIHKHMHARIDIECDHAVITLKFETNVYRDETFAEIWSSWSSGKESLDLGSWAPKFEDSVTYNKAAQ